jgi:GNAT superfamily N-acetyltransferase
VRAVQARRAVRARRYELIDLHGPPDGRRCAASPKSDERAIKREHEHRDKHVPSTASLGTASRQLFSVFNHRDEQVAYALVELDFTSVNDVLVDEDLRRRGIATALYDHIEREVGHKLRPHHVRYADGRAFWKARELQSRDREGNT